jgi:hypothetical protein
VAACFVGSSVCPAAAAPFTHAFSAFLHVPMVALYHVSVSFFASAGLLCPENLRTANFAGTADLIANRESIFSWFRRFPERST